MTGKSLSIFAILFVLGGAGLAAAEKPVEGSLTLNKKTWQLSQGVAYESSEAGDEVTVVLLTNQPIPAQKLKEGRAAEAKGDFPEYKRPYLKLVFKKDGTLREWHGMDNNTSVSGVSGEGAKAALKIENGRATGSATHPLDPSAMIPRSLEVKFNIALLKANEEMAAGPAKKTGGPAANVKPTVSGTFKGNGTDAKLNYVSARWTEPFSGKKGILLVFTEKDHSKDSKPDNGAMFGKYGNALIISTHEDGAIYSCQVVHNAMKNKGFSSSGSIEASPFTYADGKVEGEITTNGPVDTFSEKWEVKLKFEAPLGETPKEFQVAEEKPAAKESETPADAKSDAAAGDDDDSKKAAAGPGPKGKEVALTKDASNVEYKGIVGQIGFQSGLGVKAACADLSANLKAQGWNKDGSDLITPASSILRRRKDAAKLTIFVKPDGAGSKVNMMTEGLAWDGGE